MGQFDLETAIRGPPNVVAGHRADGDGRGDLVPFGRSFIAAFGLKFRAWPRKRRHLSDARRLKPFDQRNGLLLRLGDLLARHER